MLLTRTSELAMVLGRTNMPPSPTARDLPDITDIAETSPNVPTCGKPAAKQARVPAPRTQSPTYVTISNGLASMCGLSYLGDYRQM